MLWKPPGHGDKRTRGLPELSRLGRRRADRSFDSSRAGAESELVFAERKCRFKHGQDLRGQTALGKVEHVARRGPSCLRKARTGALGPARRAKSMALTVRINGSKALVNAAWSRTCTARVSPLN